MHLTTHKICTCTTLFNICVNCTIHGVSFFKSISVCTHDGACRITSTDAVNCVDVQITVDMKFLAIYNAPCVHCSISGRL